MGTFVCIDSNSNDKFTKNPEAISGLSSSDIYQEVQKFARGFDFLLLNIKKAMNGNIHLASKAAGVLCSTIDINKDGKFSYHEIAKYCADNAKKQIEQNAEIAAFADVEAMLLRFDKDNDRKLSKTEFVEYFKGGTDTPYSDRDYVLKFIDLDKDGSVSTSELQEWFKNKRIAYASRPHC
ncbi:hypothetical protein ACTFIR_010145 [Dictyostelium discoideum]